MNDTIASVISALHYWKNFINEKQVRTYDYIIVLLNKDEQIMHETLKLLSVFQYEKNVRRILLVGDNKDIEIELLQYAKVNYEFYICDSLYINNLCRVISREAIFSNIIINEFSNSEFVDAFDLVGLNNITKREIIAKGIFRLDYVPTDHQIDVIQNRMVKKYVEIDWKFAKKWIPLNKEKLSTEVFCHLQIKKLIDEERITKTHRIYIFGKTLTAKVIYKELSENEYCVVGFLDNRADAQEVYENLPVYLPEDEIAIFDNNCRILVSILRYKDVCEQLNALGYELGKHVFLMNSRYEIEKQERFLNINIVDFESKVNKGFEIYQSLQKMYPDMTFFICPYQGTGDIYLLNLYLPEFIKKNNLKKTKLVVASNSLKIISQLFDMSAIVYDMPEIENLLYFVHVMGERNINVRILDINIYQLKNSIVHTKVGLDYNTMLQKLLFKTCLKKENLLWKQYTAQNLIEEYNISKDKTIIISPYATTLKQLPESFWLNLTQCLNEQGYQLFTNVANQNEKEIKGTKPIFIPFSQIISFMDSVRCFIGLRSGLCDVISSTQTKMVVLYSGNVVLNLYSLKKMGLKLQNLLEFVYEEPYEDLFKEILCFVEEKNNGSTA